MSLDFLLIIAAVIAAACVLGASAGKRTNFFRKQWVAWLIAIGMAALAIGIGWARSPASALQPDYRWEGRQYLWDNAHVLSDREMNTLDQRNERLWNNYQVTIGVVTCEYGKDDLGNYAMQCAEQMGLGGWDMIVVLDIKGDNYWLVQGADLVRYFTDADCSDYAYDYMEDDFARGLYGSGVLKLTEQLEAWYGVYFG